MDLDADENDGFDWEAAAAAMENISLLEDRPKFERNENALKELPCQNVQNVKCGAGFPPMIHTKLQQKTLLSFVQRSNQQPSFSERINQLPVNSLELTSDDLSNTDRPHIDLEAASTWVYPVNVPMRDYQYSIVQTALFSNTLVSLPTGLGKTLIAAVVMYNFFRWFPTGKIVFTAPSRPLVLQQIEACHDSVGIPQEYTIDMTGQMNPGCRATFWQNKRVFFLTPQVFEKDIQSGSCPMQDLVCLVVDEAHRAMGNYAYCVVVRKLLEVSVRLRILALTATPGSNQATIQSVVDNLRISCLEYRNENDPDVKQFVHNKKLELVQVPMDTESVKIRDLFLEVLQPFVNRLCAFGVFYSKDAGRLVPYEFLTARDKFRQAPPPGLDPRQYGEVEACFGATITLYHVFKLLYSHGIRPAFEMLKEKLQSGPFGRLMGRNEKLQEIRLLMQKHVCNGASSPKLTKLLELMADHFESNDPSKTRVIVFTNFRESVKDILEALKILGDIVKAMEFIGQSSGKSSKGQSQKVQQLVLQKFRMGGFNTIVATSIAEEGLDIMEVDLVVCFDANVSPLRMIQRMGRTGRKRDGRVIILASEGAEAQGYLKKQAKSKVLGKHMHNGGVHSFNFHTSPRMVPHSIKPEPQLMELAITKFVPRVKGKQKIVQMIDPCVADLKPEESLTLRRYIDLHQPARDRWKPSLIAFPHYQLLPTQVYNIKHSERTTSMLIDTLQSLHEFKTRRRDDNQVSEVITEEGNSLRDINSEKDDLKGGDYSKEDCDKGNDNIPLAARTSQSDSDKMNPYTTEGLESTLGASLYSSPTSNRNNVLLGYDCQPHDASTTLVTPLPKPFTEDAVEDQSITHIPALSGELCQPHDASTTLVTPLPKPFTGDAVEDESITHNSALSAQVATGADTIGGRCTEPYIMEKVSVSGPNSIVQHLPSDCHTNCALYNGDDCPTHVDKFKPLSSSEGSCNQGIVSVDALGYVQIASPPMSPLRSFSLKLLDTESNTIYRSFLSVWREPAMTKVQRRFNSSTKKRTTDLAFDTTVPTETCFVPKPEAGYFVASTPEGKMSNNSLHQNYPNGCEDGIEDDSPRLCTLAEQGLVPLSPGLESNFSVSVSVNRIKHLGNALSDISSSPQMQENTQPLGGSALPSTADRDDKIRDGECKPEFRIIDDTELTRALSAIKVSNEKKEAENLSANLQTPVVQLSDGSNWNNPSLASCSAQKPRKFRRLCKAKQKSKQVSRELQPPGREKRCSSEQMKKCAGKQKLRFAAMLLVDEEAEVSSGEEVSTDEDVDDEEGSLQGFIDDQVEASLGTSEGTEEPIDMMAVYRKSLLTQSPLEGGSLPWMRRRLQTRTPVSGDSNFTMLNCSESILSVSSDSHGKVDTGLVRDSMSNNRELQVTPIVHDHLNILNSQARGLRTFQSSQKESAPGQCLSSMHSTTKVHERKRKLSFQQEQTITGCPAPNLPGQFDDDLFAGLDLDALEVEAVQKSRSHLQGNCAPQPGAPTGLVQKPSCNEDADPYRTHDEDVDFFPSFNLGIDC